jgi:hypothetical protein
MEQPQRIEISGNVPNTSAPGENLRVVLSMPEERVRNRTGKSEVTGA